MTAEPPLTPRASRRHSFYAFSSVALLTVQGTAMSIVLRYSRIRKGSTYVPSVSGETLASIGFRLALGRQGCGTVMHKTRPHPDPQRNVIFPCSVHRGGAQARDLHSNPGLH